MFKKFAAAIATVSLFAASPAFAGKQDFRIHNETGQIVATLHVSPSSETRWGPDLLPNDILEDGATALVTFDRHEECLWDIRVTYADGSEDDWRQINLCETTDVTIGGE